MFNPVPVVEVLRECLRDPKAFASVKHNPVKHIHDGMTCKDCGKLVAEYSNQTGPRFCDCEVV